MQPNTVRDDGDVRVLRIAVRLDRLLVLLAVAERDLAPPGLAKSNSYRAFCGL